MNNLMLHTGAHNATIDEVQLSWTPPRTQSHVPIPHIRLIELLRNSLDSLGVQLTSEEHGLAKDGQRYFGLFGCGNLIAGVTTMIGARNSHDMVFPASLCLGPHVTVCDNLLFSGDVKLSRKHTTFIERDLPGLVMRGTEKLIEYKETVVDRIGKYKDYPLTQAQADHAVCTMVRGRGIMPSQVGGVLKEFDNPSYTEHLSESGQHTVWTLYNAISEIMKQVGIFALPKRSEVVQAVCDSIVMH